VKHAVFTIGYEKRDINGFIEILKSNQIELLIDIRANGHSRKPGFSGDGIERRLSSENIGYVSMRKLGTPRRLRDELKHMGYAWFFGEYEKHLESEKRELHKLEETVKNARSCLMCYELRPRECHRSVVANKLEERGFTIYHL